MTSAEYWAERERQKQERVDEITDEQIEKIRKAIADTIDALDKEIHRIYMKYAVDNKMEYADVLRYLTDDERAEFQRDLKYYIEKYHDPEYVKKYQKELHSLSVRARVQRIEAFIANIKQHASDLEEMLNRGVREEIESVYTEGYLRTLYDVAGNDIPEPKQVIPAFDPVVVREIMETPWSGKNYSKKVWDLSGNFADKLEEVLTQGLIQGKHPDVIAREFRALGFGKTGKGGTAWRAETLIRTEAANVIEQAQLNCYKELNTKRYVFMTSKDFRVCSVCAELNGKDFPVEDARAGKNYPPMHPICRCTTRAKTRYDDEDESQYDLPYDKWYEKYVQPELDKMDAEKELAKISEPAGKVQIGKEEIEANFGELLTDDVIFMKERMAHARDRHPEAYDFVMKHYKEGILDPDLIYEDHKNARSVIYVKNFTDSSEALYMRLVLAGDNPNYKNSIISGHMVGEDTLKRIKKKNKLLYSKLKK